MNLSHKEKLISFFITMHTLIRRGIHFCYRKLIEPKSTGEDTRRHEYILNIILTGFITLMVIFETMLEITHIRDGRTSYGTPFWVFGIFIIFFSGLLTLSRRGKFLIASYLFIATQYILVTYTVFRWGVEIPLAILIYAIIIIISSILISTRFSLVVTGIIGTTVMVLGYLQIHHITSVDTGWKTSPILINDTIQFAIAFSLITILTWLSNKEIESSLKRARASESALITERDNLEITVAERTREIKSLQAEKVAQLYRSAEFGRLSSGLFHDLMNPLTALIGSVDRMKSDPTNTDQVETYLEKSVSASRRMGTFLGSIRKQINRHALLELFSCDHEITEAIEILTYRAREANVTLELKQLDTIPLFGNPLKFHQIAINLIANAIDAYNNIELSPRAVIISLIKNSCNLVFTVEDFGSGIPEDLLATIFDPFFTTKDPYHGTGLGLSTTKTIVEQDFNGTIQVISSPNKGSVFVVTIPLA